MPAVKKENFNIATKYNPIGGWVNIFIDYDEDNKHHKRCYTVYDATTDKVVDKIYEIMGKHKISNKLPNDYSWESITDEKD